MIPGVTGLHFDLHSSLRNSGHVEMFMNRENPTGGRVTNNISFTHALLLDIVLDVYLESLCHGRPFADVLS